MTPNLVCGSIVSGVERVVVVVAVLGRVEGGVGRWVGVFEAGWLDQEGMKG